MGDAASDNSTASEAVQRATAVVRAAISKLQNPLPERGSKITGDFVAPLLSLPQQQMSWLDFNPLLPQSLKTLASQPLPATKAAADSSKPRPSAFNELAQAMRQAAAQSNRRGVAQAAITNMVKPAVVPRDSARKFTLLKPSLQEANEKLIDVWSQIAATAPTPELKNLAESMQANLQMINVVAPRARSSTGATLGKLLQQIEVLADESIASLAPDNAQKSFLSKVAGVPVTPIRKPAPLPALVKLGGLVGDLWQQTFSASSSSSSAGTTKSIGPKKALPDAGAAPASRALLTDDAAVSNSDSATPRRVNVPAQPTTPPGAAATTSPLDVHAIASGLNEVLREQAWLAGVDLT